jgi:hypothetical protein
MNTAFFDAQNLAWKIHLVEAGFADKSILQSYEPERRLVAETLLDFDAKYAALFSRRKPSAGELTAASKKPQEGDEHDEFVELFKASCEFTSGYGVAYGPNVFNWSPNHPAQSSVFHPKGTTLRTGRIMLNANVTRVVDANVVHLEQEIPVNGSFRIFLFAGIPSVTKQAVADLCSNLMKKTSFYKAYERNDIETVSYHERHNPHSRFFTICTIFAAPRASIEISKIVPSLLARYNTHVYADDIEDPRQPNLHAVAHAKMGLDQQRGAIVVVRPDGYVGCVIQLIEGNDTHDALNEYFGAFTSKPLAKAQPQAHL